MDFSGSIFETTIEIGQLSEYRTNLKVWDPCHWLVGCLVDLFSFLNLPLAVPRFRILKFVKSFF